MSKEKRNHASYDNQVQTDFDSPLNPRFSVGIDVDLMNPTSSSAYYEGNSIDAHRQVEQANEFLAEDEISQQRDNL